MKKSMFFAILLALTVIASGQNPYLELTFAAVDNTTKIQFDSIKVMNRTQNCDTVLYSPDTLLLLDSGFGTHENIESEKVLQVFQNYPNPVIDQTTVSIHVPDKDVIRIIITDVMGRVIVKTEMELEKGMHSFRYEPGTNGISFFTAQWRDETSSIRILSTASQITSAGSLKYIGGEPSTISQKSVKAENNFTFSFGDGLLYIGYAIGLQSGMLDAPEESQTYTFQFATNIPCPGMPTVEYEGQVYNTIQVFSQCWLKENLNVGMMISVFEDMADNDTIEKYCYNSEPDSCTKYGGLYQWNEMMQYATQPGAQGICPPGWHLPTNEEWKVMEGAVDSQYGIGDNEWNSAGYRGTDAGANLKTTSSWYQNGNGIDLFGFSGLPGGRRYLFNYFIDVGEFSFWYTSTEVDYYTAIYRHLHYTDPGVGRAYQFSKNFGYSVRCLQD